MLEDLEAGEKGSLAIACIVGAATIIGIILWIIASVQRGEIIL
jgi:hypothetical protein